LSHCRIQPGGGDTGAPLNRQKRMSFLRQSVPLRGKRLIDCGCGAGEYVWSLLAEGADAWGIEYDETKVHRFWLAHPAEAFRVQIGDMEQMEIDSETYDVALVNEALEHVPNDRRALAEIRRILKLDGYLVVFAPNRMYPFETHGVRSRANGRMLPISTPLVPYIPLRIGNAMFEYWARNYWPIQLRRIVRKAGFSIIRVGYLWPTFENISGQQGAIVDWLAPAGRHVSRVLERCPITRVFGVSQVILAQK
jgi:ubiquinone/menaquinone biosynthesis C-methylase UbiE